MKFYKNNFVKIEEYNENQIHTYDLSIRVGKKKWQLLKSVHVSAGLDSLTEDAKSLSRMIRIVYKLGFDNVLEELGTPVW